MVLLLLAACTPPRVRKIFLPLALNNTWQYRVTRVTTMKGLVDTATTALDSTTTVVVAETTNSDTTFWRVETRADGGSTDSYLVVEDTFIRQYSSLTDSTPITILKELSDSASWVIESIPGSVAFQATVAARESVTVPAGSFAGAYRVQAKLDTAAAPAFTDWYVEDVGRIRNCYSARSLIPGETTTVTTTTELTGYALQ